MGRTKDTYQSSLYNFLKYDIEVVCPQCSKRAIIKTQNFSFRHVPAEDIKLICVSCGYSKMRSEKPGSEAIIIGAPVDPFFHTALWLQKEWNGNIVWAYNKEHLSFLKEHVGAKLRERNGQKIINKSIGSILPRWMTAQKNREVMLQLLDELVKK